MGQRGRKASVRYYASKGGYFTHFEGQNIRLATGPDDAPQGPTYLAALEEFRRLMQVGNADTADQANTVRVAVDLYGQYLERNGQARGLEILLQTCTSAIQQFGDKTFAELKPVHVIAERPHDDLPAVEPHRDLLAFGPDLDYGAEVAVAEAERSGVPREQHAVRGVEGVGPPRGFPPNRGSLPSTARSGPFGSMP